MNKYKFTKENGIKILKGACIALGSALAVYLAQFLGNTDFGAYTPIAVAVSGILLNASKEWIKE